MSKSHSATPLLDLIRQPALESVKRRFDGCTTDEDALPLVAEIFALNHQPSVEQALILMKLKTAQHVIGDIALYGKGIHDNAPPSAIAAEADALILCIGTLEMALTPVAASTLSDENTEALAKLTTNAMAFAQAVSASRGSPRNFSGPVATADLVHDFQHWWTEVLPLVDAVINAASNPDA